jgi:hypothetical protein
MFFDFSTIATYPHADSIPNHAAYGHADEGKGAER